MEEHSLNTAKRLHVAEKAWAKLANHFTILLSDKDTEMLTKLQVRDSPGRWCISRSAVIEIILSSFFENMLFRSELWGYY